MHDKFRLFHCLQLGPPIFFCYVLCFCTSPPLFISAAPPRISLSPLVSFDPHSVVFHSICLLILLFFFFLHSHLLQITYHFLPCSSSFTTLSSFPFFINMNQDASLYLLILSFKKNSHFIYSVVFCSGLLYYPL